MRQINPDPLSQMADGKSVFPARRCFDFTNGPKTDRAITPHYQLNFLANVSCSLRINIILRDYDDFNTVIIMLNYLELQDSRKIIKQVCEVLSMNEFSIFGAKMIGASSRESLDLGPCPCARTVTFS